jgi:hypothetical protein
MNQSKKERKRGRRVPSLGKPLSKKQRKKKEAWGSFYLALGAPMGPPGGELKNKRSDMG